MPNHTAVTLGPFAGVHNTPDVGAQRPAVLAQNALNLVPADASAGGGLALRSGYLRSSAQMNGGSRCHGIYDHVDSNATHRVFAVVDGKMYRLGGIGINSNITFTDVTPAGISITSSPSNAVYMTAFFGDLIVSDGINRPWIGTNLSSTPITGTYIDLDGAGTAWTATGPAVVYGAKLFFIVLSGPSALGTDQSLVWSEEAAAATGYQQSGYDNAWTLSLTETEKIYALCATNTALYYFRANSIGAIAGTVNADFRTTATHDAVDLSIGTQWPNTVVDAAETIWFADRYGRPWRFVPGSGLEPIWQQMRGAIDESMRYSLPPGYTSPEVLMNSRITFARVDRLNSLVKFCLWHRAHPLSDGTESIAEASDRFYVFNARTGTYLGEERIRQSSATGNGIRIEAACSAVANGAMYFLVIGTDTPLANYDVTHTGYAWLQSNPMACQWYDAITGWTDVQPVYGQLVTDLVQADGGQTGLRVHHAAVALRADQRSGGMPLTMSYTTPYGTSSDLTATVRVSTDQSWYTQGRASFGFGPNAQGRWVRLTCTMQGDTTGTLASTAVERPAFERLTAFVSPIPLNPDTY